MAIPTRANNPTRTCPSDRRKGSAFHAIAELLEFPDHACGPCAFGLGTHRRTPFLVADPLMEDQPEQLAEPMGDGPDGLFVSQPRQQAMKCHFKYASFDLDRGLSCLVQ